MKRAIIFLSVILALATNAVADELVQVVPFTTSEKTSFDVAIEYSNASCVGLQFDMYVPDCITVSTATITSGLSTSSVSLAKKTSSKTGYNKYRCIVYSSNNADITSSVESGSAVLTVAYTANDDATTGFYPIYFDNTILATASLTSTTPGETSSYCKVGTSASGDLALTGTVPGFVVESLNDETDITTLDLSDVTSVVTPTEGFAFVDGRAITVDDDINIAKATYARTVSDGTYASVNLPFAVTTGTFYVANEDGVVNDEYVKFNEQTGLSANTPAIAIGNIDVSADDVTLSSSIAKQTITSGYYLKGNKIYSVNGSAIVNPYRAYWTFGGADVKGFTLGTATGIANVEVSETQVEAGIYDLSGRKLSKAAKGVNIINGKKVLTK